MNTNQKNAIPASLATGPIAVIKRTVSALSVASIAILAFIYAPLWVVPPVVYILAMFCQVEFYSLTKRGGYPSFPAVGCILGLFWLFEWELDLQYKIPIVAFVILAYATFSNQKDILKRISITLLGFLYIPVMFEFFLRLILENSSSDTTELSRQGLYLLLFVIATIKISDMGGFAFGKAFGKHKMCPTISPKKSWEGLIGGIFASIIISIGFVYLSNAMKWDHAFWKWLTISNAAIWGVFAACIGTISDLIESKIKRICDVKDSSNFLPAGMGGFLDTFDSIIFAPALFYVFLMVLKLFYV